MKRTNHGPSLVEQFVAASSENHRLFLQERAIYEVTEMIECEMEKQQVSRSELASRLGRTKGWVTQLLDGDANKTIRTVADVLAVLGRQLVALSRPARISNAADCEEIVRFEWPDAQSMPSPSHVELEMARTVQAG